MVLFLGHCANTGIARTDTVAGTKRPRIGPGETALLRTALLAHTRMFICYLYEDMFNVCCITTYS
jgi:hypothetical protein